MADEEETKTETTPEPEPESEEDAGMVETPDEEMSEAMQVATFHANHAKAHGMAPGHMYSLHTHNDAQPLTGRLLGTNDLGVLMLPTGSNKASFHPWGSVKALTHG